MTSDKANIFQLKIYDMVITLFMVIAVHASSAHIFLSSLSVVCCLHEPLIAGH